MTNFTSNVSVQQRKKIWRQISPDGILFLAEQYRPSHGFHISGNSVRGRCIHHSEDTASFYITPSKGAVKCFGCNYYEWDPISFIAALTGKTEGEALSILVNKFKIKLPKATQQRINEWHDYQIILFKIAHALNRLLKDATADDEDHGKVVQWLQKRKITQVGELPIGVLARPERISKYLTKNDLQIYQAIFNHCFPHWIGSIVYTYHLAPRDISGFKLRRDFMLPEGSDMGAHRFVNATGADHQGFFLLGQPIYSNLLGHDGKNRKHANVYVVEGETDAMQWFQKMLIDQRNVDVMILGSGGAGSACLTPLSNFGLYQLYLVADHPKHQGEQILTNYLKHTTNMDLRCFEWPKEWKYKDPDEFLKANAYKEWKKILYDIKNENYFFPPHKWTSVRALAKFKETKDFKRQIETITYYGQQITDAAERDLYIIAMAKATGIEEVRIRRSLVSQDDTMEGFIARIERYLCQLYDFIGKKPTKQGGTIIAWNRLKQDIVKWRITRQRDLETYLSYDLGSLVHWVQEHIGIPNFIKQDANGRDRSLPQMETELRSYVDMAVKQIKKNLKNISSHEFLREGIHWLYDPDLKKWGWYILNGNKRFRGLLQDDGVVKWDTLDSPIVDVNILHSNEKWSDNITSVDDLKTVTKKQLKEIFYELKHILSIGWTFKNQDIDTTFLAASIMMLHIIPALPRQQLIIINAPRESGKSTLLKGLLCGEQNKHLKLVDIVKFFGEDYTAASLRQSMRGVGLHPALDEFEDKENDARQSARIRDILGVFRGMVGGSATIQRGSRDQENPVKYELKFSPICASIRTLSDSADITRFCQIVLENTPGRESPERSILREYTHVQLSELNKSLTTCMFGHVSGLTAEYAKLQKIMESSKYLKALRKSMHGAVVDTRFLGNLQSPASFIEYIEEDGLKFTSDFVMTREDTLSQHNISIEHRTLYQEVLSSSYQWKRVSSEGRPFYDTDNIRNLLKTEADREVINDTTASGVKYIKIKDSHWLVVHWQMAQNGILKHTFRFKGVNATQLRNLSNSAPEAIPSRTLQRAYVIKKMFGPGTSSADVSAFDITQEIKDYEELDAKILDLSSETL